MARKKKPAKKSAGRPGHVPTQETDDLVKGCVRVGIPHEVIAKALLISVNTLKKHYAEILESEKVVADCAVANALYENATIEKNVAAQIFWCKTRLGWRENVQPEAEPKPIKIVFSSEEKPASREETEQKREAK